MCPGELLFYWSEHTQRMLNKLRSQLIWITACSIDFTRYRSISSNISNCITNQAETPRRSRRSHTDNEHILYIYYVILEAAHSVLCSHRNPFKPTQKQSDTSIHCTQEFFFLMTEILISEVASSFAAFRTPQGKNLFIFTGHFNRFSAPSATQI